MNKSFTHIAVPIATIIGLLLMVAWIAGAFTDKLSPGSSAAATIDSSAALPVISRKQTIYEPVPASIQAKQATVISSRILSRIEKIHVRSGDTVSKGQLLLELDETDLQSRLSQTQAGINAVNARLTEAKLSLTRATDLIKTGVIARADLDKARANHDMLVADLANAQQASREAEAALGFAKIRAPISGRVVDRFAEPGDTAQPGMPLLSLYNPLTLRIEAHVRERLALSLALEQTLQVDIPAIDRHIMSTVEELVPAGNPGSRNFLVKSRLQYSEGLLPGMYARLIIPAGTQSMLLIPAQRVARVGQLDVVWVVKQGVAERRFIRTGKRLDDGMIEVISGLSSGEKILPSQ